MIGTTTGAGNWWWMAIMMIVFWGGLIWLAVTLIRRNNHRTGPPPATPAVQTPQEVLAHRLARGEIGPDDYRQHIDAPAIPPQPTQQKWTSLDLVLLAWLQVIVGSSLPTNREQLYDEVINHEYLYWKSKEGGESDRAVFERSAAHLTASSLTRRADAFVAAPGITDAALDAFATVWAGGWRNTVADEGLALRPDAIGDHLVRRYFGENPDDFVTLVANVDARETARRQRAKDAGEDPDSDISLTDALLANLARAETDSADAAAVVKRLLVATVRTHPRLWRTLLQPAGLGSTAATAALQAALEAADDETVEGQAIVEGLTRALPLGHTNLRSLALDAAERAARLSARGSDSARAEFLNNLGHQAFGSGPTRRSTQPHPRSRHHPSAARRKQSWRVRTRPRIVAHQPWRKAFGSGPTRRSTRGVAGRYSRDRQSDCARLAARTLDHVAVGHWRASRVASSGGGPGG